MQMRNRSFRMNHSSANRSVESSRLSEIVIPQWLSNVRKTSRIVSSGLKPPGKLGRVEIATEEMGVRFCKFNMVAITRDRTMGNETFYWDGLS